ncbi:hypothetical protein K2X14_09705 [Acetobacter sp. TBRC 12305]|uniref:Bacterial transcriptional activator domain-containing protein n=1 Tax=Acetobacter garciniae TaxID=2817435 RepID=A0A939HQD1_9PROT|nr:BTAD domain-containing putative transcriptional regulator [Acetobacter garciniae]MBO1326148.1 hypothetical protein [Acetobacter garciniae]MBX0345108.1 hypothetical protein [Acetobacter garciniae]
MHIASHSPPPSGQASTSQTGIGQANTGQTGVLHITLLGHMAVTSAAGVSLLPTGAKTRALLAILALSDRRAVARTRLAELLWCRRGPEQARASLRQEIHRLLGALAPLGPRVLDVQRHTVALRRASVTVDAERVLASTPATVLSLPDAPPPLLEDLGTLDGAFRTWLDGERARLDGHVRHQLEALLAHAPDPATVKEAARRILLLSPLHEAAWQARIKAEIRNGEEGNALSSAKACLEMFRTALGGLPGQETMRLIAELRAAHDRNACAPHTMRGPQPSRLRAVVFLSCPVTTSLAPTAGRAAGQAARQATGVFPPASPAPARGTAMGADTLRSTAGCCGPHPCGTPKDDTRASGATGPCSPAPDSDPYRNRPGGMQGTDHARRSDNTFAAADGVHPVAGAGRAEGPQGAADQPGDVDQAAGVAASALADTYANMSAGASGGRGTGVLAHVRAGIPADPSPASGLPLAEQFRDELTLNLAVHDVFDLSILPERLAGVPAPAPPCQRQADFLIGITLTGGDRHEIRCTLQAFDARRNDTVIWGQRATIRAQDVSDLSHRLASTLVSTLILAAARHVAGKPDSALSPMEKGLRAFILTLRADAMPEGTPQGAPNGAPERLPEHLPEHLPRHLPDHAPDSRPGHLPDRRARHPHGTIEKLIRTAQASSPEDPFLYFVHARYLLARLHDDWRRPAAQTAQSLVHVLRRALAVTPTSLPCRYLLAAGLFHAGQLGEAQALLALMHDASRIDSRWGMLVMLDALSALCAGDAITAARLYGEFFSLTTPLPGGLLPSQNFILSCFLAGRHADTLRHAQGMLAVNPGRMAVLVPAMAAANSLGYQDLVRDYQGKIRARHPDLCPRAIEQHYSYVPRSLRHQLLAAIGPEHGHGPPARPKAGREHHADAWRDRPERI